MQEPVSQVLSFLFNWIVVPMILVFVFRYGLHIMARAKDETQRISAQAGFGAGLVIFLAIVATQLPTLASLMPTTMNPMIQFSVLSFILWNLAGMAFLFLMYALLPGRLIGVIVLILTAASTIGLYGFLLIAHMKSFILSATLGVVLGAHLHLLFFPKTLLGKLLPYEVPDALPPFFFGRKEEAPATKG